MSRSCQKCGAENPEEAKFCARCGAALPPAPEVGPEEEDEGSDRFKTLVAVLIAIVSMAGAVLAWRISLAASSAGDADISGIVSTVNRNQALMTVEADMYRNLRTYLQVRIHDLLSGDLVAEAQQYPGDDPQRNRLWEEAWTELVVAESYLEQVYIRPEYIRPDGSYDGQAARDIDLAHRALNTDFDSQKHFDRADRLRMRVQWLVGLAAVLSAALLCYTLATVITRPVKYLFLALGSAIFITVVIALPLVERALA